MVVKKKKLKLAGLDQDEHGRPHVTEAGRGPSSYEPGRSARGDHSSHPRPSRPGLRGRH